jgi:hypothetical protein
VSADTDGLVSREPVHIPPLTGDVVFAWPMFPNPDAGGMLWLPVTWQVGDETLACDDEDALTDLAAVLGELLKDTPGEVGVESVDIHAGGSGSTLFTHRLHFTSEQWHGPPDWAVRVEPAPDELNLARAMSRGERFMAALLTTRERDAEL